MMMHVCFYFFFFFQAEDGIRDYKVTGVQTCALPICWRRTRSWRGPPRPGPWRAVLPARRPGRSEEHTSELQSPCNLVCRLLLEKKKTATSLSPTLTRRALAGSSLVLCAAYRLHATVS